MEFTNPSTNSLKTQSNNSENNHESEDNGNPKILESISEKRTSNSDCDPIIDITVEQNCPKKWSRSTGWRQYAGLVFGILASLFLSIVLVLVKVLSAYHPFCISMWRQFGNIIPSIPLVLYFRYGRKEKIFDHVWPLNTKENKENVIGLAVRGFLGANVILLKFSALKYLTIADTTVITYTGPIFIIILAYFFLNEKNGFVAAFIGVWTLLGVVLIARPPILTGAETDVNILIGIGITLVSVLCQSAVTILVRRIRKIHFAVMTLAFGLWGFGQSLIVSLAFGVLSVPEGLVDLGLMALLGILSYFGQMCNILSLKFEEAGAISLIRTIDVLFAFTWQILLLDVLPDSFSILGASVVTIGVVATAVRKYISTLPEENKTQKFLSCILK